MRANGDDGVLEVRRGTIVKQVMPYIASNSTSRRLDEAYGALSLGQSSMVFAVDLHILITEIASPHSCAFLTGT